jgi:hypothetical protein
VRQPRQREQRTTELLHELFCHYNHTDQCGWYYEAASGENKKWTQYAHAKYLAAARELLLKFNDTQGVFVAALVWIKQFREEGKL